MGSGKDTTGGGRGKRGGGRERVGEGGGEREGRGATPVA